MALQLHGPKHLNVKWNALAGQAELGERFDYLPCEIEVRSSGRRSQKRFDLRHRCGLAQGSYSSNDIGRKAELHVEPSFAHSIGRESYDRHFSPPNSPDLSYDK